MLSHEFEKRRNGNLRTVGGPHTCATRWREGEKRLLTIALYLSGPVTGRWRDTAAVSPLKPIRQVINAIPSAMCERNGPEMCKRCRRLPTRERSSSTQLDIFCGRFNSEKCFGRRSLKLALFESSWTTLHFIFWLRSDRVKCLTANSRT